MDNRELATKIFDHLVEKGAGIGNASIILIESVLDKELKNQHDQKVYEYSGQDVNVIVQAPNDVEAYQILRDKLQEEDLEHDDEDIGIDQLINITATKPGVVAFFDNRIGF